MCTCFIDNENEFFFYTHERICIDPSCIIVDINIDSLSKYQLKYIKCKKNSKIYSKLLFFDVKLFY